MNVFRNKRIVFISATILILTLGFQNCSNKLQSTSATVSSTSTFSNSEISNAGIPQIEIFPSESIFRSGNINFTFTSKINETSVNLIKADCKLTDGTSKDCIQKNYTLSALVDGDYKLTVQIQTQQGIHIEKTKVFRIDSSAPTLSFSSTPSTVTNQTNSNFHFLALDNLTGISKIECSWDNSNFSVCTSPSTMTLSAGTHNFKVRAYDFAGHISEALSYNWTIDLSANIVSLIQKPAPVTNQSNATFTFSGNFSSFECQLNDTTYTNCGSPYNLNNLNSNSHTLKIRGKLLSGEFSVPVTYTWLVDTTIPKAVTLTSSTSLISNSKMINMSFNSSDVGSGILNYQCLLDSAAYTVCSSPFTSTNLIDGNHTLKIKSFDQAGNSSAESVFTWLIDTSLPIVNISTTATTSESAIQILFTTSDSGSGLNLTQCSLDSSAFSQCQSPATYTSLVDGAHTFKVQVTDKANNISLKTYSWISKAATTTPPTPNPETPTPPIQIGITSAVPGTICPSSSGIASFFPCNTYFNSNISAALLQEVGALSSNSLSYYAQQVCSYLFPTSICPGKLSSYNSTNTPSWSSAYSSTLLNNFGNSFGPNGLQISNSVSIYINTSNQRTYTIDTAAKWLSLASDIYTPYLPGSAKVAAVIPAPPLTSGPMPGFSSANGETCDGKDCYYLVADAVQNRLIEVRGATVINGKLSGQANTVLRTKSISLPPTVTVWNFSQYFLLNGNVTINDTYGYYQRDHCASADGAGLMVSPLAITAAELNAGYIRHAVRFIIPNKKAANYSYVRPATNYPIDASSNLSNWLNKTLAQPAANAGLPYGSLLRLLPTCKVGVTAANPPKYCIQLPANLTAYDKVLITALQNYGMYLADSTNDSGNASITTTNDVDVSKFSTISSLLPNQFEIMPTPSPFNPANIYHDLAASDYGFFTGSDTNGSPVAAWSAQGGAACLRRAPASGLMTW